MLRRTLFILLTAFLPLGDALAGVDVNTATAKQLESLPGNTPLGVQTPVQLGPLLNNHYPLRSGLSTGETVVVSNTALLSNGMPVKVSR